MKNRINYWTCSKFADFIRGEKKPYALEWHKWEEWRKEQKEKRPWRYWMSDTLLRKLQNFIYYPSDLLHSIRCYLRNRYVTQTHVLKSDLKKGQWYDLDTRILHCLFNELVEFVEIELAHLSKWDRNKKYKFKNGRCVEAAYDYFEWVEKNFDDARIKAATEPKTSSFRASYMDHYEMTANDLNRSEKIRKLYEWWVKERPKRSDPLSITKETHGKYYFRLIDEIEQEYAQEDTNKLIELIKIRESLWT